MSVDLSSTSDRERENVAWLAELRGEGPAKQEAMARLRALLLRAARFEVSRRRATVPSLRAEELEVLAVQAAEDALVAALARLGDARDASCFTTWASKFALFEAGVRLRRLAWQEREVGASQGCRAFVQTTEHTASDREVVAAVRDCIADELTPQQQQVLVTLVIEGVPIDVLAERWTTTRGALYQALHDGRRRIRTRLTQRGLVVDPGPAD